MTNSRSQKPDDGQNSLFLAGLRYFWRMMKNHMPRAFIGDWVWQVCSSGCWCWLLRGTALAHARLIKSSPTSGGNPGAGAGEGRALVH